MQDRAVGFSGTSFLAATNPQETTTCQAFVYHGSKEEYLQLPEKVIKILHFFQLHTCPRLDFLHILQPKWTAIAWMQKQSKIKLFSSKWVIKEICKKLKQYCSSHYFFIFDIQLFLINKLFNNFIILSELLKVCFLNVSVQISSTRNNTAYNPQ